MKNPALWLLPALAVLMGCATNRPAMNTWNDPSFSPMRTDKISLTLRAVSPDDMALGRVLKTELERAGFNLVTAAEANYLLMYVVENNQDVTYITTEPPSQSPFLELPPQTDRERMINPGTYRTFAPGVFNQNPYQPLSQPLPPTKVVFTNKKIRLDLYTNPKTRAGGPQLVWTGWIDAGETISPKREPLLIEALLRYFGKDYSGRVTLGN